MKTIVLALLGVAGPLVLMAVAVAAVGFLDARPPASREQCDKLAQQGNYKDAYDGYRALALDPKDDPTLVGKDLQQAISCLLQLQRADEVDSFREAVIEVHKGNWRLLEAAAQSYLNDPEHYGFIVAGEFHRGPHRGGGRYVNVLERDRVRALQLLVQGLDRARSNPDRPGAGRYLLTLAGALLSQRAGGESWRLQSQTPLDALPDFDEPASQSWDGHQPGAPVDADGTPVYYRVPHNFAQAKNDGERWRWALAQAVEADPGLLNTARYEQANFLLSQFGTQTLGGMMRFGLTGNGRSEPRDPHSLQTLKDDETIARLSIGIKRFTLPDEFNPIKILQTIADDPGTGHGEDALAQLASIFGNRRQFDRAAGYVKRSKDVYGDPGGAKNQQMQQILGAWGQFEPLMTQPAGRGATVDFRFRNGRRVHFEAHEVRLAKLLSDVKEYIASSPPHLDWQQIDVNDVGSRLVALNQQQYLGRLVARWELELEPPSGHFDKRITVSTPLQKAGAYLLTARMEGGNASHIMVCLDDTVIVKKFMEEKVYHFIADSRTGQPVPRADVDLFGWRMVQVEGKNQYHVETKALSLRTDDLGQVLIPTNILADARGRYQWLCTARTPEGRLAHLGFAPIWGGRYHDPAYDQVKVYTITDRPVYRPGQPVRFKFWVAHARYDQPDASDFAHKTFTVEIQSPKGEKVLTRSFESDAFGGFDGSFELSSDAALGVYQVHVTNHGGGSFRVEEYKKPEFEVSVDAPTKPVMLGEKVPATIKAKYYFGSPVAEAKVKYKVTRTTADERWYPVSRWDWLFGPGYWWFAADSSWYPGWSRWGIARPAPWWWNRPQSPPEVVAQAEAPIRPDGTFPIEIDTAPARATHPDEDQRYEITAEVTDQSRRTIVGTGTVLVARQPFTVYTWVDRGHYRTGDTIDAAIRAQTLDRKPVAGKGTLKLLQIRYDTEGKPFETPVESWDLALNAEGQASQTIKASAPGQYRLSSTIDDGHGHSIEGGYLFAILGQGFDGSSFRFNDLEIIPDRKEYRPGDTLRLLINTNQVNSTVLLFVRPTNGVYLPPRIVRLRGKSTVEEIGIVPRDMPNLFVEALTVANGRVHSEAREIAVPPESRVVDLAVEPAQNSYKPGQKAKVKLKLTGPDGKPFVGSTVLTVYDKAVEAIAGGSNVADIKEFFWRWKRTHYPRTESSLDRWFPNLVKPNETGMQEQGVFDEVLMGGVALPGMGGMGGMGRRGRGVAMFAAPAAAAPMTPQGLARAKPCAEAFEGESGAPSVQPVVRTNFADTAFWTARLTTQADGTAEVEFPLPESLTTWKVKAWALGPGTRVGQGEAEVITTKDLLVRLQAPRFFVQKDEVVLSANVHNKLKTKKAVQVVLECEGSVLELLDSPSQTVEIAAGGEHRVDWRVKVAHEGQAVIRMKALTDEESDAAQMTFPAYVHGMLKMEAVAGAIRPDQDKAQVVLRVPEERRPELSRLEVRYSPTLAGALVDALPYLADYPYGCTEQTLNRFLPAVITQKVLINLGVDLKAIRDKRTNLNAQELGDARERARRWKGYVHNPVFDQAEVARMVFAGIGRLADMQLSDGGWGWFSGYGEFASAHTTAQVVHGLQLARQNDLALPPNMLERGVAWLTGYQAKQAQLLHNAISEVKPFKKTADDLDALVFMVLADGGVRNDAMLGFLDRDRTHLSVYAKAIFGLGLERLGEKDKLAMVLQNLGQYVVQDLENQTAYLKLPNEGYWWWWYGSEIETDAFYLKLLARTDPKGELASRLVKYVLNNRKHGSYWNSTRDTAYCIEALADHLRASGEDRPDMTVAIALDGQTRKEVKITPADLFRFDNAFVLEGKEVTTGSHTISFTRQGKGPVYY
ncbi:MAG: alpha-2-macroglobulin family protein, partial [Isosphaeraceae bacterium]